VELIKAKMIWVGCRLF